MGVRSPSSLEVSSKHTTGRSRTLRVVLFVVQSLPRTGRGPAHPPSGPRTPRSPHHSFFFHGEFVFLSIRRSLQGDAPGKLQVRQQMERPAYMSFGRTAAAMATKCASCLPLSLRSRPGRGRSLMAASSPSSTNRLRALATVRALTETASAASRSDSPSSAFSNARATAPAGYLNQIVSSTLYSIRVRPPWKIIPKTQSHILYQHFMEPVLARYPGETAGTVNARYPTM